MQTAALGFSLLSGFALLSAMVLICWTTGQVRQITLHRMAIEAIAQLGQVTRRIALLDERLAGVERECGEVKQQLAAILEMFRLEI